MVIKMGNGKSAACLESIKSYHERHPFVASLVHLSNSSGFEEIFDNRCLCSVATYVITDRGSIVLKKGRSGFTTFGGCNFPNSFPRMMNSLRLELMDEAALLLAPENTLAISPVFIRPVTTMRCVLLQVVLIRHEFVAELWCPEKARNVLRKDRVPNDIVFRGDATEDVKRCGRIIVSLPLAEALTSKGKGWRTCDWESFKDLHNNGILKRMSIQGTVLQARKSAHGADKSNHADQVSKHPIRHFMCMTEMQESILTVDEGEDEDAGKADSSSLLAVDTEEGEGSRDDWEDAKAAGVMPETLGAGATEDRLCDAVQLLLPGSAKVGSQSITKAAQLAAAVNGDSLALAAFRRLTREPWQPVLWDDAADIFMALQDPKRRAAIRSGLLPASSAVAQQQQQTATIVVKQSPAIAGPSPSGAALGDIMLGASEEK